MLNKISHNYQPGKKMFTAILLIHLSNNGIIIPEHAEIQNASLILAVKGTDRPEVYFPCNPLL